MTVLTLILAAGVAALAAAGFVKNWSVDSVIGRRGAWWLVGFLAAGVVIDRMPAVLA